MNQPTKTDFNREGKRLSYLLRMNKEVSSREDLVKVMKQTGFFTEAGSKGKPKEKLSSKQVQLVDSVFRSGISSGYFREWVTITLKNKKEVRASKIGEQTIWKDKRGYYHDITTGHFTKNPFR